VRLATLAVQVSVGPWVRTVERDPLALVGGRRFKVEAAVVSGLDLKVPRRVATLSASDYATKPQSLPGSSRECVFRRHLKQLVGSVK
jgi:hypothetical protein